MRFENRNYVIIYELVKDKSWVIGSVYFKRIKIRRDISMSVSQFMEVFL